MLDWESSDWIGLATVVTAGASLVSAFRSNKAAVKSEQAVNQVTALEVKVDGRLTQLLERTASASKAEGVVVGRGEMATIPIPPVTASVDPALVQEDGTMVIGVPSNPTPPVLLVPVEDTKEKDRE